MVLTEKELIQLKAAWGTDKHDETVDSIKVARGGQWPTDWYQKVIANPEFDTAITVKLYDQDGNLTKTVKSE